jgi:hypothetical protein
MHTGTLYYFEHNSGGLLETTDVNEIRKLLGGRGMLGVGDPIHINGVDYKISYLWFALINKDGTTRDISGSTKGEINVYTMQIIVVLETT